MWINIKALTESLKSFLDAVPRNAYKCHCQQKSLLALPACEMNSFGATFAIVLSQGFTMSTDLQQLQGADCSEKEQPPIQSPLQPRKRFYWLPESWNHTCVYTSFWAIFVAKKQKKLFEGNKEFVLIFANCNEYFCEIFANSKCLNKIQ